MTHTLCGTASAPRPSTPAGGTITWRAACRASWQKVTVEVQVLPYLHGVVSPRVPHSQTRVLVMQYGVELVHKQDFCVLRAVP